MPYQVMISYKRGPTSNLAREIRDGLARVDANIMPFLDQVDLKPSDRWRRSLEHQLSTCHAAVVLLCDGALESKWVRYELHALWRRWNEGDVDPAGPGLPLIVQPIGQIDPGTLADELDPVDTGQLQLAPLAVSADAVDVDELVESIAEHARRRPPDFGMVERKMVRHLEICRDSDLEDMVMEEHRRLQGTPAEQVVARLASPETDIEDGLSVQRALADRTDADGAGRAFTGCATASMMSLLSPEGINKLQTAADRSDEPKQRVLISDNGSTPMLEVWFQRAKLDEGRLPIELGRWCEVKVKLKPPADPQTRIQDLADQFIRQVLETRELSEAAFEEANTLKRHILIVVPSDGNADLTDDVLARVVAEPLFERVVIAIAPGVQSPAELHELLQTAAYAGSNPAPSGDAWKEMAAEVQTVAELYEAHYKTVAGAA